MTFRTKQHIDFWLGSLLLIVLFLPVRGLGLALRRDHSVRRRRGCAVVKLVGAGSLFLATPSLQAIRSQFPEGKFFLIGTKAVIGLAENFGWFDRCWTIDDASLFRLTASTLRALCGIAWHCDHLIDLEVHSRLTTVFSVLTGVRNRIGFVDDIVLWRRGFYTHMTFFNSQGPVYVFYDMLAAWFGVSNIPVEPVHAAFGSRVRASRLPDGLALPPRYAAIGPGCSDFGHARQLRPDEWQRMVADLDIALPVVLLGGPADHLLCAAIMRKLDNCHDLSGQLGIAQSAAVIAGAERFIGIDSLLLHLARALDVPCDSVWGPTDPRTRLRPGRTLDRIYFSGMPCAPCIHVHETPPCGGVRACIPASLRRAPQPLPVVPGVATGWVIGPHDRAAYAVEMSYD